MKNYYELAAKLAVIDQDQGGLLTLGSSSGPSLSGKPSFLQKAPAHLHALLKGTYS